MKTCTITLKLTPLEARMLALVAGNGWGDGDFRDWINNKAHERACKRALDKLADAAGTIREGAQT